MSKAAVTTSLAFKVVLFFARNPTEELSCADVEIKFATPRGAVTPLLRNPVQQGLLCKITRKSGWGVPRVFFSAGPALLEMIGIADESHL